MMWEAEYSRGMNSSNLLVTVKDGAVDRDSIEMFHYNNIPWFLPMRWQVIDDMQQFRYDITSRRSLDDLLDNRDADFLLLRSILTSFGQACGQAAEYMLSEDDILLKPEYIFIENSACQAAYCYLPGNEQAAAGQFREFMEYLLQHIDHKDEQAVQLAYGVYQRVAEEGESLQEVLAAARDGVALLAGTKVRRKTEDRKTAEDERQEMGMVQNAKADKHAVEPQKQYGERSLGDSDQNVLKHPEEEKTNKRTDVGNKLLQRSGQHKEEVKTQKKEKLKNIIKKKLYTDSYRDLEEDVAFDEEPEEEPEFHPTVCLAKESQRHCMFVYQGTDRTRDFSCTQGIMTLGSSASECDVCIPSPMVSRVHAKVYSKDGETYLEDMNSTNGTQVNGTFLKYREQFRLRSGDIVSLAGENYCFR